MALNVERLRREAQGAMWVSPARVCLAADGALVSCEDTRAVKLLVGEGGSLPVAEAERYGLVVRHEAEVQEAAMSTDETFAAIAAMAAVGGDVVPPNVDESDEPAGEKAQEPAEDKQITPPANKRPRISRKR